MHAALQMVQATKSFDMWPISKVRLDLFRINISYAYVDLTLIGFYLTVNQN